MPTPPVLNWYHLADSAFPTGGFAFSSGLEAAAKLGVFTNRAGFAGYLRTCLEQFTAWEIPFLNGCYLHPDGVEVMERYHAGLSTPSLCRASLVQGRSLLRSLAELLGAEAIADTRARLPRDPDRRHLLLVYGWGLQEQGMDLDEARRCLLYINLRDWISAAIRLGSVGPMEGHRLQHQLLGEGERMLTEAADRDFRSARRVAPALDIAQSWHHRIYSKLFQN